MPMEVMGLMLGEFVDDYTVKVVDVFAMPQSGTGVSVEAVDPVFQTKMLDMLKQVGRCAALLYLCVAFSPGFQCCRRCANAPRHQAVTAQDRLPLPGCCTTASSASIGSPAEQVEGSASLCVRSICFFGPMMVWSMSDSIQRLMQIPACVLGCQ